MSVEVSSRAAASMICALSAERNAQVREWEYLAGEQIVLALGVTEQGFKRFARRVGFIETNTENSVSISQLLRGLQERGFSPPTAACCAFWTAQKGFLKPYRRSLARTRSFNAVSGINAKMCCPICPKVSRQRTNPCFREHTTNQRMNEQWSAWRRFCGTYASVIGRRRNRWKKACRKHYYCILSVALSWE